MRGARARFRCTPVKERSFHGRGGIRFRGPTTARGAFYRQVLLHRLLAQPAGEPATVSRRVAAGEPASDAFSSFPVWTWKG